MKFRELAVVVALIAVGAWWFRPSESISKTVSPTPTRIPTDWWQAALYDLDANASDMAGYPEVRRMAEPASRPRPATKETKVLYEEYCASCHGDTGAGDGAAAAAITTGPPTDLRHPAKYKHGTRELSIWRTTKFGVPNTGMAPVPLTDIERWKVIRYVRSLQR